ncbi:hypothetical protein U0070_001174 [Myodes glareolus]|uniref:Uncharacterized protein n=1 Tax=Myodes glareolus TaxID=447135 RepID=A0AAW0HJN3_MYOGA
MQDVWTPPTGHEGVLAYSKFSGSQPCTIVEVEFLPVYQPRPQESKDPTLYANNVQRVMAQALGIPVTECEFVGSLPVIVVDQLKAALKPQLWELEKTVGGAFSYFQQDAKGLVDFQNVALALAALDGGRTLEELIHLAFELFAEEQAEGPGRLLYRDCFSTILIAGFTLPCCHDFAC